MNRLSILGNNLRALAAYRAGRVALAHPPTYFWIEPTNHCNLKCVMCPTGAGKLEVGQGLMEFDLYRQIIDRIAPYASAVTLAVNGEPLLHPRFFDMVSYAAGRGIKVLVNTNATLLTQERGERLLDAGISGISFAFDGFTKSMYENVRLGAGFDDVLEKIESFLRLKRARGVRSPYCVVSVLDLGRQAYTTEEREAFVRRLSGLADEVRVRQASTWGATFKDTEVFEYQQADTPHPPCSRLWSTTVIAWNGDVLPCIYNANHEYILGNLKESELMQIWNGERMATLRASMLDGSYLRLSPLCDHCNVLSVPPIMGIPSGLRLTLADSLTNLFGFRVERWALKVANRLGGGRFVTKTLSEK